MRKVTPMRLVRATTLVSGRRWRLTLACGHDVQVIARTRPIARKYAPCPRCAAAEPKSSTRGGVHAGCGGRWRKPEQALERAMPGLVDRCSRCGEERA